MQHSRMSYKVLNTENDMVTNKKKVLLFDNDKKK